MSVTPQDHRQRGRRLVLRFAGAQIVGAVIAAVAAFALSGATASRAALAGGLVVAVGNVVFGWRMFAPGIAPIRVLARAVYVGELLKWLWLVLALWVALVPGHLPGLPLIAGMLAAQLGFWVGLAVIR